MGIPMDGYIGYNGSPGNESYSNIHELKLILMSCGRSHRSWEYPWMVILVIMEALGMSLEIPMDGYI